MLTDDLIIRGDPVFVNTALKFFSFLGQDYRFEINGFDESYETCVGIIKIIYV